MKQRNIWVWQHITQEWEPTVIMDTKHKLRILKRGYVYREAYSEHEPYPDDGPTLDEFNYAALRAEVHPECGKKEKWVSS